MRISLLSMSFEQSLAHGQSFELSFDPQQRELLKTNLELQQSVENSFQTHKITPDLTAYLNSEIETESNHTRFRRQILLNNYELLDQEEYAFERFNNNESSKYSAFFESLKYVKSPLQFLIDSLKAPIPINQLNREPMKSHRTRIWLLHDIIGATQQEQGLYLERIEEFALSIGERFSINKASKRLNKKLKNEALEYLSTNTVFNSEIVNATEEDILQAPLSISTNYDLDWQALDYFESLGEQGVIETLKRHCQNSLKGRTNGMARQNCRKESRKLIREYFAVNSGRISRDLRPFYDLLKLIVKVDLNRIIIANLFGNLNLENSGYMQSQTIDEQEFRVYF